MKSMLNLKTIVKVLAAVSFVGGMSFAWGDAACDFQGITDDTDLVKQANNCYKYGQYGLLVHKWDGQDPFGENIDGYQEHPELSISSSLISKRITAAANSNCTICTYNEPDNPMSHGGVIYDLSYLKEKMSSTTNESSNYGTSPILCGFSEDGGTINRPSRAGCGVTKNAWKDPNGNIICGKDIWYSITGTSTKYWPDNNKSDECTSKCTQHISAGFENCVGNVPSVEFSKNNPIPYYIKGSQASYNFDKKVTNPIYSGNYDEVLNRIIYETGSSQTVNNYNEILLDQSALKSKENPKAYDAKSIVAFFVTNKTDQMNDEKHNTCTMRKDFSTKYGDLPILSLDTNWTDESNENGPFSLFSSRDKARDTCKDASLTCSNPNPSDIKVWTSGNQNTYKFCVHPTTGSGLDTGDTYICTQQNGPNNHCPNSGPGPSSVPAYWKKQLSTQT